MHETALRQSIHTVIFQRALQPRRRTLLWLVLAALLATSCSASFERDEVFADSRAEVIVSDFGVEPRVPLRLTIGPGCTELLTITATQELMQVMEGVPLPSVGVVGTTANMIVTSTRNGEHYDVRTEIISANATPETPREIAAQVNLSTSAIVGFSTFHTLTKRAELVPGSARLEGAEALGPAASLLEGLNQLQAPLPEEAVGVGAQWQTTSALDLAGVPVTVITNTELISIDGSVIELASTTEQRVPPGSVLSLDGVRGDVHVWKAPGKATTKIDLARATPIQSSADVTVEQSFTINEGGGTLLEQVNDMSFTSSGKASECFGSSVST